MIIFLANKIRLPLVCKRHVQVLGNILLTRSRLIIKKKMAKEGENGKKVL